MSLLVFAGVATAAAGAAYLTRNWSRVGSIVGFAGLLLTLAASVAIEVGDRVEAAGGAIEATAYGRLFVIVGLATATLVLAIARLSAWQRNAPAAVLGGTVSLGLGLASPEAAIGLLACGGAALVATLVALAAPLTPSRVRVLAREVRGAAVGLILGLAAVSLLPATEATMPVGRVAAGLALLIAVGAVGHRLAAVPFHARASRLAEAAPALALPLLLAWIPAAWAIVLLEWAVTAVDPLIGGVDVERLLIVALAVATVALGTGAALAQDEIEKAAAYALVAGASLVILVFAALEPEARDGMRAWLPAYVAAAGGLAGWTIAIRGAFGTGRVDELAGWIRRAPLLATALVGIGIALLGWPGAATWDGRAAVVAGVVGGPAPVLAVVAGIVPLLALVRLVFVGAARPGPAAIAAAGERPRWGAAVLGPGRAVALRQASPAGESPDLAAEPTEDHPELARPGTAGEGRAAEPLAAAEEPRPSAEGELPQADAGAPAGPSADAATADRAAAGAEGWRGRAGLTSTSDEAVEDGSALRGRRFALPGRGPRLTGTAPGGPGGVRRGPAGEGRAAVAAYLLDANRVPLRAGVVLLLALATLLVAAGAFDLREAAAGPPPAAAVSDTTALP
ncbi:MAG: hypothetical protein MUC54_02780 [Chloroflexi bacterium]|nr:hypothetical protein [Chloroflexota bacterium]